MGTDVVRLGIVGAGSISVSHLDAMRQVAGAKATAICDVEERAAKRAAEYNIAGVYTDYRRMLAEAPIDAVIVAVPNYIHHEVAIAALQAGKHVLCEKPMAINSELAAQMVQAAEDSKKLLAIGLVCRYAHSAQLARQLVSGGDLGKVYYTRVLKTRRKGIPGWGSWFTQKEVAGGGPVFDIGVHSLDLAWWALGCPQPVSVTGMTHAAFGPQRRGLGTWGVPNFSGKFDVEDMGAGFIRFADGSALFLETSWAINAPGRDTINIVGDQAGIEYAPVGKSVHVFSEVENHLTHTVRSVEEESLESMFARQMRNFVGAVADGASLCAPGDQGLVVTRMLEAIYTSAQTGKEVRLD